jgi:hypothetical protein
MELTALSDLLDLQEVDSAIDRLRHRRQNLPELEQYRQVFEAAGVLAAELKELEARLHQHDLAEDKSEGELQLLELKLKEHETRLYAGGMSAREAEYMRMEVESLRGQRSAMEEKTLGLLDVIDPLLDELKVLRAKHEALLVEEGRLKGIIEEAWGKLDAEIGRKQARRSELALPIPAELTEIYEGLRKTKQGVGVGRLEGGVCGGCHLALSKPEQAEAARSEPPRCIHCLRILVM